MRGYIEQALDEVDASIFTGDAFLDENHRIELRDVMYRWEMKLREFDKIDDETSQLLTDYLF